MRRLIGQCHKADLIYLAHISELLDRGEEVDLTNLTNRQKIAVQVLDHFNKHNIPLKTLTKIKEVLVWEMDDGRGGLEFKLMDKRDIDTVRLLNRHR